jgi:hypothetical protein
MSVLQSEKGAPAAAAAAIRNPECRRFVTDCRLREHRENESESAPALFIFDRLSIAAGLSALAFEHIR